MARTAPARPLPARISLVLSDVDGTAVTSQKTVPEASRRAVARLAEHGIAFSVTSSRPPFGLRSVIEAYGITAPVGAFNGGSIVRPDLTTIAEKLIPADAAERAVALFRKAGVGVWVFAGGRWLVTDPAGDYIAREVRTVSAQPTVVADFGADLARSSKIVGVSADFDRLAALEPDVQAALGGEARAGRSQRYYLDVTPPGVDKGTVIDFLAGHFGIAHAEIVTIGDMDNDVPMFRRAGYAIAMGNGSEAAKDAADSVTGGNDDGGFAAAITRLLERS